jgi:hypothetical protein
MMTAVSKSHNIVCMDFSIYLELIQMNAYNIKERRINSLLDYKNSVFYLKW